MPPTYPTDTTPHTTTHHKQRKAKKSNKATPYPSTHLYLTECTIFRHRRTSGSNPITNRRQAAHIP